MSGLVHYERRVAVRTNREALRQYTEYQLLQEEFVTYRTKVELAVDTLREVARELHHLEIKKVKHKKNGYITATFGSGVAGTALVGGILTAGPIVTAGLFLGTVLTSAGTLVVYTAEQRRAVADCEEKVNNILQDLEVEFAKCVRRMRSLYGEEMDIEEMRQGMENVMGEREENERELNTVHNIIRNIQMYTQNVRSRVSELPADLRLTLEDGLEWVTYFLSPAGAARFLNIFRNETRNLQRISPLEVGGLPTSNSTTVPPMSNSTAVVPTTPTSNSAVVPPKQGKPTLFSSCGNFGKAMYTAGAVAAAWEFYNSITKAGELSKKLQRLRDSSDLLKYEGAAKEVFNIALDLQVILSTVFRENEERYVFVEEDV